VPHPAAVQQSALQQDQVRRHLRGAHLRDMPAPALVGCTFAACFAFTSGFATYPLLARSRYDLHARSLGLLYAATSTSAAVGLVPVSGALRRALGVAGAARVAQIWLGIALAAIALAPARPSHLAAFVAHGLAFQIADTFIGVLASESCKPQAQGRVQGILQATQAVGRMTSPLLCGSLYSFSLGLNPKTRLGQILGSGNLPFVFAGTLAIASAATVPMPPRSPACRSDDPRAADTGWSNITR